MCQLTLDARKKLPLNGLYTKGDEGHATLIMEIRGVCLVAMSQTAKQSGWCWCQDAAYQLQASRLPRQVFSLSPALSALPLQRASQRRQCSLRLCLLSQQGCLRLAVCSQGLLDQGHSWRQHCMAGMWRTHRLMRQQAGAASRSEKRNMAKVA